MKQFYLLFLIIPFFSFSQIRKQLNETDLSLYNLNGSVKEVIHTEYEPKYSNDSTYTLQLYDFLGPHNYKLSFSKIGNLNEKVELKKEQDSLIAGSTWTYEYDKKNRIKEKLLISHQYSKDTIRWEYSYIGDSIIDIKQLDKTYKVLYYTYLEKGEYEYLNHTNSDSSYTTKNLFVYDNQNRLIRSEKYEDSNYIKDLQIKTYTDSISQNVFKEVNIWTKYKNNFYRQFEYDKNNNPIKMIIGRFDNNKESINCYEYIYDKKGNWIIKKHFGRKGKLSTVYKREIKYY